MALIVIRVWDGPEGAAIDLIGEPRFPTNPEAMLTPAQVCVLTMIQALDAEIKDDFGLRELYEKLGVKK